MAEKITIQPAPGRSLADQLFDLGVEFPCGGASACGGCRVRILEGDIPVTFLMREALTAEQLAAGWRLACDAEAQGPVTVEVDQWTPHVLTDESHVPVEESEGLGAVIDLGTTTLVAQLVDLRTGEVLGVRTSLNPQARHGADVMSRIEFELERPGVLTALIRESLGGMIVEMAAGRPVREVLIAGNTVMHHLFCGLDVKPLSHVPFRSESLGEMAFAGCEIGWPADQVRFLPCAGGFVGSDLVTGVVACGLANATNPEALMDLGTNGEIAVVTGEEILCASTAAGPAFEGGRIRMGMRAGDGAIDKVEANDGVLKCHVIGGGAARGLCGSGLVDAVSAALDLGLIAPNGRIAGADRVALRDDVALFQADIRQLQLAKGAIAAGLRLLTNSGVKRVRLAGAFGNYVRSASARRIGLLPDGVEIVPEGNSALRGARLLLLAPSRREELLTSVLRRMRHIELASDPVFQDTYVDCMALEPRS